MSTIQGNRFSWTSPLRGLNLSGCLLLSSPSQSTFAGSVLGRKQHLVQRRHLESHSCWWLRPSLLILRQILPDAKHGLGIPIDFSMDPLTVVAQGAALFAGAQKLTRLATPSRLGEFSLNLEYKPVGNDTEPLVGGRVKGQDQQSLAGYVLRFTNSEARPPWDSGKLPLSSEGTFIANLWAEPGLQNVFQVELYDTSGTRRQISPSQFAYTVGLVITDPPLTHDIGIAMADNKVDVLFKKGTPLPAKVRTDHRTAAPLRKGDHSSEITIPFVEGNNSAHADLNRKIGHITINARNVVRDLPVGAEVEIRLEIDSSRLLKGTVYIPVLDQEFPLRLEGIIKPQPSWQGLRGSNSGIKNSDFMRQESLPMKDVASNSESQTWRELRRKTPLGKFRGI